MPLIGSMGGNFGPIGRSRKPFNLATGGIVSEYSIGGMLYRQHLFTTTGTFSVVTASDPFDILLVAGGTGGGSSWTAYVSMPGGVGGAGGQVIQSSFILSPTTYSISSIGAGGTGSVSSCCNDPNSAAGSAGGPTSAFNLTASGGGAAGGTPGASPNGANGVEFPVGSGIYYGGGGGAGGGSTGGAGNGGLGGGANGAPQPASNNWSYGGTGTANTGGGGGGAGRTNGGSAGSSVGGNGGSGAVVIVYQIG